MINRIRITELFDFLKNLFYLNGCTTKNIIIIALLVLHSVKRTDICFDQKLAYRVPEAGDSLNKVPYYQDL